VTSTPRPFIPQVERVWRAVRAAFVDQYGKTFRMNPLTTIVSPDTEFDICGGDCTEIPGGNSLLMGWAWREAQAAIGDVIPYTRVIQVMAWGAGGFAGSFSWDIPLGRVGDSVIASVVGVPIPPMPADILEGFAVTTGSYPREVSAIAHEVNRAIGWDDPHDFSLSQPPGDYDRQIALAGSWLTETPADVTDPVVGFSAPAAGSPGKGGASDGSDIGIAYNAYLRKDWAKAVVTLPTQTRAAAGRSVSVPASKAHQYQVYAYVQVSSPHRGIERFKIEGVTVERDLATIISSPDGWVGKAPQRWIDLGTHANDGALNITWSQAKSAETFFLRQLPTVEEAYARIAGVADPVLPAGATAPPPPNTKRLAAPHPCHTPPVFNTTHVCTHEPLTGGARCYRGLSSCWSRSRPPRSRRRIVPPKRRAGRARPIRSAAALSWPTSPS
jgi:hypothetical protein